MKKIIKLGLCSVVLSLLSLLVAAKTEQKPIINPDGTYLFAQRDTCELYMDVYEPAKGSITKINGRAKPTIIFIFGGGFIQGSKRDLHYLPWYKSMTENGYRIIAIDYRLGLKGETKVGIAQVNLLDNAIHLAIEDLFSATEFIVENQDMLNVDPDKIVLCGSSAGAITILQAEYEICNNTNYTQLLPQGFRYAGVIAFSGGILSRKGKLKYEIEPCPTIMFHGTADKLVNYSQIRFFNLGFFGSDKIAERFKKFGYNYNILRYLEHGHEIAGIMNRTTAEQCRFIETNVMRGADCIIDMIVDDPTIERGIGAQTKKELYGE